MARKHNGFSHLIILLAIVWLLAVAGCLTLMYQHYHDHKTQYVAPADASKLPPRP